MRPVFTLTPRPANIPDGWRIYNAPRPLPGVYSWQGDSLAGVFYTCQPADADESDLEALHAARVFYLSEEQIVESLLSPWIGTAPSGDCYYGYCDHAFRLIERKEAPQPVWCPLPAVPDGIFHVVQKTADFIRKSGLTD